MQKGDKSLKNEKEINPIFILSIIPLLLGLFMMFIIRGPIYGIVGLGITIIGIPIILMGLDFGIYK